MFKRITTFFLVLLLLSPRAVFAESIVNVDFSGLVSVSEPAVRAKIQSLEGTEYSEASVNKDVKSLYATGYFKDVSVSRQATGGGVKLVFSLIEKMTVGKVTVQGNKKIKKDEIREALSLRDADLLDPAKIAESKKAIYRLYEKKGYYLADIDSSIEPFDADENQVELVFTIHENKAVKIKRIRFIGNKDFNDKKLRGKIKSKEKGSFSFVSGSGKLNLEKLASDVQMLRYFYLDNGYLHVKVDEPSVTLTRDKESIYISLPVHEGKPFTVSSVAVAGDLLTTEEELTRQFAQKAGKLYRKSLEIEDLQFLERFYGDQSYAFANIVPQIDADDVSHTAKVTYYVQKGPKIKIGKILIKGNDVTRDKVIRRELRIFENAYYSQTNLEMSKTRLYQLGYFESVNVSTPRAEDDSKVDVIIEVKEKNTGSFSVGAGFSTLESFIFTASIQKDNFFGMGWSGGVSANISKLRQDFSVSMSDRYFLDTKWYFGFTAQRFQSALNRDFDQSRFGGTVSFGREIFDFFDVRMGYQIEDVSVANFSSQVPAFFQQNASGLTSGVFGSLTYDRRDNKLLTTKGYFATVVGEYMGEALGGTNNHWKVTSDTRTFFRLPKKIVLKGRGMFGYINSLESDPVALFDRFFLGGVNSLRGYDLNTIGPQIRVPQTSTGGDLPFSYGGNKMLMFNVELELPLYAQAGVAAVIFFDAGNAYGETESMTLTGLRLDYGAGLRWNSPFGPMRFEWGFPINKQEGESGAVFNFTIGSSF
jgi:outer membrane protein insertion porin family